jgi:hypothetical protein
MTPEEKFSFDLEGYLVIKNVLSKAEVEELNALADEKFPFPEDPDEEALDRRGFAVSRWGPATQKLIDHPKVAPYLSELLGPRFRIDHDYCIFMRKGGKKGGLHGGPGIPDGAPDHWYDYKDGTMRNGLCVLTYFLSPAREGDGGFACVPGSHKSNFKNALPDSVRSFERPAHYVAQPKVETGDALFFTEALIHGTMPWMADHERRALLFKYSPGHSAWMGGYYNPDDYKDLTEQQRRIMAPPSVGRRPASLGA